MLMQMEPGFDAELLLQLVNMKMPFGRFKDTILCDLPVSYLEWFQRKGFPHGKLGILLQTMYEIKLNGLDYLLVPLKKMASPPTPLHRRGEQKGFL